MQREKATCLPRLTVETLLCKLALVHPRTARRLHDHTSKTNNTNKEQYKNSKNGTGKVEKDVEHDARIACAQESLKTELKCERYG